MGKKIKDVMAREGPKFIESVSSNGYPNSTAESVWDLLQPFAGYAFNKCVIAETELIDALTGERTTVGALYTNPRDFTVHALGSDGKLYARRVTDVMANGHTAGASSCAPPRGIGLPRRPTIHSGRSMDGRTWPI